MENVTFLETISQFIGLRWDGPDSNITIHRRHADLNQCYKFRRDFVSSAEMNECYIILITICSFNTGLIVCRLFYSQSKFVVETNT